MIPADNSDQNKSIIKRLLKVMNIIIMMIIIVLISIIVSNQPLTEGLVRLNEINQIQAIIVRSIESLTTVQDLVVSDKKTTKETFQEASQIFEDNINRLKVMTLEMTTITDVAPIIAAYGDYKASVSNLFLPLSKDNADIERAALTQMYNEMYEGLRGIRLEVRTQNESTFNSIYRYRFTPIFVGLIVSLAFISFVFLYGLNLVKYIQSSIKNLTIATEEIASGNLKYRAPILGSDELSTVTKHFNTMVDVLNEKQTSLRKATERIVRLQTITTSFSEALTSDEVCKVILHQGFDILNAEAGGLAIINPDTNMFEFRIFEGYGDCSKPFEIYPVNSNIPVAHAVRENTPLFFSDVTNIEDLYPEIKGYYNRRYLSLAVIPLVIGKTKLGAINFSFVNQQDFSIEDRNFMLALAKATSQALHRALLFENAKKAVSLRDEFLSIASHELKTPLTPLKLHLQSLKRIIRKGEPSNEQLLKIATNSDRQINRLSTLIEDLLDVSRISAGKLKLSPEKFNLSDLVHEILINYGDQIKKDHSIIHIDADPDIIVSLDRIRMEQVLVNLLTNAGKYAPGKPVEIKLKKINNERICLQVIDQGPGISPEDQIRIFDRFERVQSKDNIGGLGLGLYISKQIIEAHGGHISVTSELGKGAKFNLDLPLEIN